MLALGNRWVLGVGHSMELGWSLFLSQVILQMWKEKLREANGVAQGHTASKQHSQGWCSGWLSNQHHVYQLCFLDLRFPICSVAQLCLILFNPMDVPCQAPLSMGFPRQEYWSGLPFPSPGNLPDPGIESRSPAGRFFAISATREPHF